MSVLFIHEEDASHYITIQNKEATIPSKFKSWSTFTIAKSDAQASVCARYQYTYHYLCWKLHRKLEDTPKDKDLILTQLAFFKKNNLVKVISTINLC